MLHSFLSHKIVLTDPGYLPLNSYKPVIMEIQIKRKGSIVIRDLK
jgi:hypothetical protein